MQIKLVLILLYAFISFAQTDTIICSDGKNSRYFLSHKRIDSSSIIVDSKENVDISSWVFDKKNNSISFESPIDSGVIFTISYTENYINFPKKSFLYEKKYKEAVDSLQFINNTNIAGMRNSEQLAISGFKSFSISADNYGSLNLEQGLDIRIAGDIRPGTVLSAHLNDQGSSLEGSTREISDFDLIYIQLSNPNYTIIAGDQYVSWISNGFLNQQKKIKGISASISRNNFNVKAFGSLSGGSFVVQNIICKDGVQGPYFLKGNGENGYISPISGTVDLKINGKELKEGKDYTVNYDLGYITFKNSKIINDKDLVTVEYEYKLFDYQKFLTGINAGFKTKDSSLVVNGSLWTDLENKNNPIDLTLSEEDNKELKSSGDSLPFSSTAIAVNPKDVASYSKIYSLYKKSADENGNSIYVYTQYDYLKPEDCNDFYQVWFVDVGENNGEYKIDTVVKSFNIFETYVYTGKGKGRYVPLRKIPAPERIVTGELSEEFHKKNIIIKSQFAGENKDKNTFSSKDDEDNNSSAVKSYFLIGRKEKEFSPIWLSGSFNYVSKNFSREIFSKYELLNNWNDTSGLKDNKSKSFYDLSLGISPANWINTEMTYGENRNGSELNIYKLLNTTNLTFANTRLSYNGQMFNYYNANTILCSRKESLLASLQFQKQLTELLMREEWNKTLTDNNFGLFESKLSYTFTPLNWIEEITYSSFRKGLSLLSSSDTGQSVLWEQSINFKPVPQWNLKANSSYKNKVTDKEAKNVTLLINLENSIQFKTISLQQQYSTNFEKASSYIQVPVYAGNGLGSFMYDSILKEFIEHSPGDWLMQEKEMYDQSSDLRVRKTDFTFSWTFVPPSFIKGIFADLKWEGNLLLQEHIDANEKNVSSWFPGYSTLKNYKNKFFDEKKIRYANLSYRQEVEWDPNQSKELSASLYFLPGMKKIRTYYESTTETGLQINRIGKKWAFIDKIQFSSVRHDDIGEYQDMKYQDLKNESTEKYFIAKFTNIYLKECLGIASQTNNLAINSNIFENKKNFYYQLSSGIQWQPVSLGSAELSYTYSKVPDTENRDYRIANGYQSGISHVISATVNVQASKNLQINSFYRGELNKNKIENSKKTYNQILSIEAKVLF